MAWLERAGFKGQAEGSEGGHSAWHRSAQQHLNCSVSATTPYQCSTLLSSRKWCGGQTLTPMMWERTMNTHCDLIKQPRL
ncbi:hypothetical protein AMELA_G00034690 [Ameiurus melas]|uniref:Uncharacterized protein n=1 Tax=Ameiurus melas TaxID=219545 RepID=A0A7J6B857_AMEME|nr:hypothetical protein AMELA_G00034690 [Ameiurus melas]